MPKLLANLDAGSVATIVNVPTPVNPGDAVNKAYVDNMSAGLTVKEPVRAATTAPVNLAAMPAAIDGITLSNGDRFLAKNQGAGAENGIYVFNGAGAAAARTADADTSGEVRPGMYVYVSEGSTQADSAWVLSTDAPIVLGTTSLTFVQFSGAGQVTAGAGLTKTGNTLDVNVDGTTIQIVGDALQVVPAVAFGNHKVTTAVGNGVATSFLITHNLNTLDFATEIRDAATQEKVIAHVVASSLNTATVSFAAPPAASAYVVTFIG